MQKNVIIDGLSLSGGIKGYKFPWVIDNEYGLFTAGYNFGMGQANLSYIKINEGEIFEQNVSQSTGDKSKNNDDAQVYLLDVSVKVDENITVRPAVMFIQGGKDKGSAYTGNLQGVRNLYGTSLTNAAVNVAGKVDIVSFNVTGAYLKGTLRKTSTDDKIKTSAYLFDLGVDAKATDMIKIGAFFTYSSGDDGKKPGEENNNYFANMETVFGRPGKADGVNYGRLFVLEGASLIRNGGPYENTFAMDYNAGYMGYGLNVEAKLNKLTLFA